MVGNGILYGKKYAAVEHAEKNTFHFLQLFKKKNEFVISKKKQANNFDAIIEELKGQQHFFLVLNDEQVLIKKIPNSFSEEIKNVRTAFPTITLSDFYYDVFTNNQKNSFVAIARKEYVHRVISNYKKGGIAVIDFSLGNNVIRNLETIVGNESIYSSNAINSFDTNALIEIKTAPITKETYKINDLEVSNNDVLALGGIIAYYTKNSSSEIHENLKENYIQKRFFDVGLKVGLGFLMLLLLTNVLFFIAYSGKVNTLIGELQLKETYKNQLNELQSEVTQKKRLVKSVNAASNSNLSRYIDELGISVPPKILLTQLNFQPNIGTVKADKPLVFESNKIIIKGASKEDEAFSKWIATLERKSWIASIAIHEFGQGKKATKISNFEFIITINER